MIKEVDLHNHARCDLEDIAVEKAGPRVHEAFAAIPVMFKFLDILWLGQWDRCALDEGGVNGHCCGCRCEPDCSAIRGGPGLSESECLSEAFECAKDRPAHIN
jgi:hypothetical protein